MGVSLLMCPESIEEESTERNGHRVTISSDLRRAVEKRAKKECSEASGRLTCCEVDKGDTLKATIHPELQLARVTCATCGTELTIRWTAGDRTVDTCSICHPAYTGRQARATGGSRIERFDRRYARAR